MQQDRRPLVGPDGVPIGPGGMTDAEKAQAAELERRKAEEAARKANLMKYEITAVTSNIR